MLFGIAKSNGDGPQEELSPTKSLNFPRKGLRMKTKHVAEHIGITDRTLYNYRKKLGILEETREEVSESQLKQFRDLASSRIRPMSSEKIKQAIQEEAAAIEDDEGSLELSLRDSIELMNMKKQYNSNQKLIRFLSKRIRNMIENHEPIGKTETDMMEKYQKLNLSLLKSILSVNPDEDNLKNKIAERLEQYTK